MSDPVTSDAATSGSAKDNKVDVSTVEKPPKTLFGILSRLGPGLIVAGSIVGSGELIATTRTGAEAGFWLLWLILVGCIIKVLVQVEFGRYSIVTGRTTMDGLNEVPGPRLGSSGNWIVWYWFLMFIASLGQLGGIVGGVGQALSISCPLTEDGREYNEFVDHVTKRKVVSAEISRAKQLGTSGNAAYAQLLSRKSNLDKLISTAEAKYEAAIGAPAFANSGRRPPAPMDAKVWAAIIAFITSGVLLIGRYGLIQSFSTVMVAAFTAITVINLILLQTNPTWAASSTDIINGMSFRLPPNSTTAVATALATFGIIGVGASELVTYPYWCIEKGYARFTGPRDKSDSWAERAQGWMRVMRWDAWCSMVVYTFATVAFYLLGAAILGRSQLIPEKSEMVRTLAVMYEPVFGGWAPPVFLFGAFAVLYSTYFVANASQARVISDVLRVLGWASDDSTAYRRRVRFFSGLLPLVCLVMYIGFPNPAALVLLSGVMQALMLPMLAGAALFFRYKRCDVRVAPSLLWDIFLWLSAMGMLITGGWLLYGKFWDIYELLTRLMGGVV
jgi:Mn2+/Fe2+ NRAMP family transporter